MKQMTKPLPKLMLVGLSLLMLTQSLLADPINYAQVRKIFPRGQGYENKIINVIGAQFTMDVNTDLGKAFAELSLQAAETYFSDNTTTTADNAIYEIGNPNGRVRAAVQGLLAVLVINEVRKTTSNPQLNALKNWSTQLFRSMKIRAANAVLNEYRKWDVNYCAYKADGYVPPIGCNTGSQDQMQLFAKPSPPEDIMVKAGLKSVLAGDADKVANLITLSTALGTASVASIALASTMTGSICLFKAFGGLGSASGAIGALGWSSVAAAPVTAVVLAVVVGTTEGIRVVEATKVEPMLKQKLGQAMSEYINLTNVLSEISGKDMFYMAFMEAATKNFKLTPTNINGEVRFYCQAGYVARFSVTYTVDVDRTGLKPDVRTITTTTQSLNLGRDELVSIPYNATNIIIRGEYWDGTWRPISTQPLRLSAPTFMCYTAFGTVFNANYKLDCPEVGNMIAKKNELTVTQGGAYTAWVYLSYKQNGKVIIAQDQQGLPIGWRKVYNIPQDATQIYLYIRNATGLAWEPWKKVVERTWPTPPNECIKIYGTTLDPKSNAECN